MKLLVRAPLSDHSGYGLDGIGIVQALLRAGHDVQLLPTALEVPIPPDVADLLTIEPSKHFDMTLHFISPNDCPLDKSLADISKINVLWTMWEFENFRPADEERIREDLQNYDIVVAFDELSTQALSAILRKDQKIYTVQGGFMEEQWEPFDHSLIPDDRTFYFGMIGQMGPRKNPLAAIIAYSHLKMEHGDDFNAELIIKTTQQFLPQGIEFPGVTQIYDNWRHPEIQNFYHTINAYICPSWGEGKNLPAMEATASGCPVILSEVSGHLQWARRDFVRFIPTKRAALTGLWGREASIEDTKEAMWDVYTNRYDWYRKAYTYAHFLGKDMGWDKVITRLGATLGLPL